MNEIKRIIFEEQLDRHKSEALRKKIWYLSDYLESFLLLFNDDDLCIGMEYVINSKYEEAFIRYLHFIIKHDIIGLKNVTMPIIWSHDNDHTATAGKELKKLIDDKYLHFHGEGQISMNKELLDLMHLFDCIAGELSRYVFHADEYQFPTLLRTDVLKKAGYFNSFPNLWMSVYRLKNEYSVFSAVEHEDGEISDSLLPSVAHFMPYSLPPTMCYYIYDMFSDSVIDHNQAITTLGKSFRFENKYADEYGRLWDFSIRETVFMGDKTYVSNQLDRYRLLFCKLLEKLDISGHCEYASDPFFMTKNNFMRINIQKMKKVKSEVRLKIEGDNTLAISSFNTHGQYIAKSFNLFANNNYDKYIFTGCIGVGLERFVLAFLSQYGHAIDNWPPIIRDNYKDVFESKVRQIFIDPILTTD